MYKLVQVIKREDGQKAFAFDVDGAVEALTYEDAKLFVKYYTVAGKGSDIQGISLSGNDLTYSSDIEIDEVALKQALEGENQSQSIDYGDEGDDEDYLDDEDETDEGVDNGIEETEEDTEEPEDDSEDEDEYLDDEDEEVVEEPEDSIDYGDEDDDLDDSDDDLDDSDADLDDQIDYGDDDLSEYLDDDDFDVDLEGLKEQSSKDRATEFESIALDLRSLLSGALISGTVADHKFESASVRMYLANNKATLDSLNNWLASKGTTFTARNQFKEYLEFDTAQKFVQFSNQFPELGLTNTVLFGNNTACDKLAYDSVIDYARANRVLLDDEKYGVFLKSLDIEALKYKAFRSSGSTAILGRLTDVCNPDQIDLLQRYSLWLSKHASDAVDGYDDVVEHGTGTTQAHQEDISRLTVDYRNGHNWEYVGTFTASKKRYCLYKFPHIKKDGTRGKAGPHPILRQYLVMDMDATDGYDWLYNIDSVEILKSVKDISDNGGTAKATDPLETKIDKAMKEGKIYAIGDTCIGYFLDLSTSQKARLENAIAMSDKDAQYIERILRSSRKDECMKLFEPLQKLLGTSMSGMTMMLLGYSGLDYVADLTGDGSIVDLLQFYYQFTNAGLPYPLSMVRMFQLWLTQPDLLKISRNIVFHLTRCNKKMKTEKLMLTPSRGINCEAVSALGLMHRLPLIKPDDLDNWSAIKYILKSIGLNEPDAYQVRETMWYLLNYKMAGVYRPSDYPYDSVVGKIIKANMNSVAGAWGNFSMQPVYKSRTYYTWVDGNADDIDDKLNYYAQLQAEIGYGVSNNKDDEFMFGNRNNVNTRKTFISDMAKKMYSSEDVDASVTLNRCISAALLYQALEPFTDSRSIEVWAK